MSSLRISTIETVLMRAAPSGPARDSSRILRRAGLALEQERPGVFGQAASSRGS